MNTTNSLKQAILKSGFLLEIQTAKILTESGFLVTQNKRFEGVQTKGEPINNLDEIDILAIQRNDFITKITYIIECKGSASADFIVLMKSSDKEIVAPNVTITDSNIILENSEGILCKNNSPMFPNFCHTGDFFSHKRNGEFEKLSKNDDQNNLYKGIKQLQTGLNFFFKEYRNASTAFSIHQLIVTNATIAVTELSHELKKNEVDIKIVPWVAYLNPFSFGADSQISLGKWELFDSARASHLSKSKAPKLKQLPIVWIVNVEHLKAFLSSGTKEYTDELLQTIRSLD